MAEKNNDIDIEALSDKEKSAMLRKMLADGELDTDLMQSLLTSIKSSLESGDVDAETQQEFFDLSNELQEGQDADFFKDKAQGVKAKELLREFADLGTQIADLSTASQQIAEGEASAATSKEPTAPRRFQLDPAINQAINESLKGISPAGIAAQTAPFTQDVQDAFTGDLNTAKIASGGQAGAFGTYAQAAVNRRLRAAGQLGNLRQQIRDANLRNLNFAMQNKLRGQQLGQQRDLSVYGAQLDQFNREQEAAGSLEQAGRINRRNALLGTVQSLLPLTDRLIDSPSLKSKVSNLANKLLNKSNSPTIQDSGAQESTKSTVIDFDGADDPDIYGYDDIVNRNLIMNNFRG